MTQIVDDMLRQAAESRVALAALSEYNTQPAEILLYELQVHRIELEMQNEQLRQSQIELEKSRDRYVDFYDFAPVGYLTLSQEGMIDEINLTAATLLKVSRNRLPYQRFASYIASEDRDRWHRHFVSVIKTDKLVSCELSFQHDHKPLFYAHLDCMRLKNDGKKDTVRMILTDITERKKLEKALMKSEERWKFALEGSGDGVWDWNIQTGDTLFSRRWKEMLGFTENEIENYSYEWFNRIHPQDKAIVMSAIKAHIDGKTPSVTSEFRLLCKDGSWLWILGRGMVVSRGAEGNPLRLVGTHSDITERKQAEAMLAFQNIEKSKRAEELVIANTELAFQNSENNKRSEELVIANTELAFQNREKGKRAAELVIANTELAFQNTEKGKRAAELTLANQYMEAANIAKNQFLANMSHEIRTPMNGVIGMVDVLQTTELNHAQQRMVETIHKSSLALLNILNDILDYSKIEAGKLEIEHIPTPLREISEGVAQLMATTSNVKGIALSVFVSPALPEWILSDPTRLRQVLLNLVGNAVKFTASSEGHPGVVTLRLLPCTHKDNSQCLKIIISDNGIGMSPEVLSRLFQPFTQADGSTARKFGGTGLGLSITQRLVEMMHGKITAQSALGIGSEFTVELPMQESPSDRILASEPSLAGLRVIAVTTDPFTIQLIEGYCTSANAKVLMQPTLNEARKLLKQQNFSNQTVMLLDIDDSTPEADLPESVAIVRLIERNRRSLATEITVPTHPLLYHDLIKSIALASGRLIVTDNLNSPNCKTSQPVTTVEQAFAAGQLILLAEDNETNREVMQEQLRILGYASEAASDSVAALKMWRSGRYALLLTDCHMPNMDGFELTEMIRAAEPEGLHLPIIAVTANVMQGEVERCLEHGMDGYLSKPLRLKELAAMLEHWLPKDAPPLKQDGGYVASSLIAEELPEPYVIFDAATLTRMLGDKPAMHRRILEKFVPSASKLAAGIVTAMSSEQTGMAADLAHQLKSAARMVGALQLGNLCEELEEAGHAKNYEACRTLVNRVEAAFLAAVIRINQKLEK